MDSVRNSSSAIARSGSLGMTYNGQLPIPITQRNRERLDVAPVAGDGRRHRRRMEGRRRAWAARPERLRRARPAHPGATAAAGRTRRCRAGEQADIARRLDAENHALRSRACRRRGAALPRHASSPKTAGASCASSRPRAPRPRATATLCIDLENNAAAAAARRPERARRPQAHRRHRSRARAHAAPAGRLDLSPDRALERARHRRVRRAPAGVSGPHPARRLGHAGARAAPVEVRRGASRA